MSYVRSSDEAGAGDPSSGLGSLSSTCSLKGELGRNQEYLVVGPKSLQENQEQLQKEYMPHLEKDLRRRWKIGRQKSEKARQRRDVPKRQYCGRYDDDER